MDSGSCIDADTRQAYLETEYRVLGPSSLVLKVGEANATLRTLHKQFQVDCSAFLTACNPFSLLLDDEANALRQQGLAQELTARSLPFLPAIGQHPSGRWPGEASFFVMGLKLEAAKVLATRLEQNAFVWNSVEAIPQLVLLR